MSWKIVPDSAADVTDELKISDGIQLEEVPLSILVGENEYIDDPELDTKFLINELKNESTGSKTACPSPESFKKAYEDADNIIAVTLSHKLSGSYNAANLAKNMILEEEVEKNIHVIDSLSTCCAEYLIVEKANELMSQDLPFETVVDKLEKYRDSLETLFTLSSFDNLIKNGRLNKYVGFFAKKLNIRIVGMGDEGELKILHKVRGEAKAIKKLVDEMGKLKDMDGSDVVIAEVNNMPGATAMMHLIERTYPEVNSIRIIKAGGINSFYAEDQGLIIGF